MEQSRRVVGSPFEVWFTLDVETENFLFAELGNKLLKGFIITRELDGPMKTNQREYIDLAFFEPTGQFALVGTKYGHDGEPS